jgi:Heterokaryon incompatibility protein (HET)
VKCEIETFHVDQAPNYEAISYAWGEATDLTYIRIGNRHRMLITKCLDSALRYLRHSSKERLLWADAICINQDKITEKNETVAQMHIIFHNAWQVIVWLGQPIRPWSFRVILNMPDGEEDSNLQLYFRGKCQMENRLNSNARALLQFGRLPWFSRGWVCQEVCFARHIQIQFGRHLLSWEHFERVAVKLASVLPDFLKWEPLRERRKYTAIQEAISGLAETRLQLQKGRAITLGPLLTFARIKATTDPRDKVFAFLNLLPAVPASLQVDYGEDTRAVFSRVAHLLLRESGGLRLLAECEFNANSRLEALAPCLPSWVPDWAQPRVCESLPGGISTKFGSDVFSAGSRLPASSFEIIDDSILLQALIWDDIVYLDPLSSMTGVIPDIQRTLLMQLGIERKVFTHPFPEGCFGDIKCETYEDFSRLCRRVEMCNRDLRGLKIVDIDDFPYSTWVAEQHQKIVGRNLMLTRERYVGWAPPATATGDVVAIIPGCHVPIVLRKVSDSSVVRRCSVALLDTEGHEKASSEERLPLFSVIGEACEYLSSFASDLLADVWCLDVHGIMEGEAVFSSTKTNKKLQRITLL